MSAGGARRGRRDNGLDAADFAVAGDVDPRVGEHLLEVLGAGGIAAYLQPSSDLNPVTRTTTMPARPVDRLYVDSTHLETARGYLAKLASEEEPAPRTNGHDPDVEAAWAKIVAGYDKEPDTTPWPAAENLPDATADTLTAPADPTRHVEPPAPSPARRPSATDISGVTLGPRTDDGPSLLEGLDTFGNDLPGEPTDDEGYTPPPPPPLPRISKYAVAGLLGIVLGFVLFLFPDMIPIDRTIVTVAGFLAILAGFVTLISRLRHGNDDDYDPDDGAKV
ncbi:DUF308 domain-containing protein [Asanoa iriomotensis]|uniref:DUF308 domain-containing protein n=1 Tax=Asanoa iriomotensis TaxID=234613 RepID=A0ABQ4BYI5_9ACTN|nr:DUF308 domain-containing protein [Asanoa iriomotensis]GIF55120.1 hypothetical protein Air01nite_12150 [Asanoa iriomotensis]